MNKRPIRKIIVLVELDGPVELTPREFTRIEQAAPPGCTVSEFGRNVIEHEVARWQRKIIDFPR